MLEEVADIISPQWPPHQRDATTPTWPLNLVRIGVIAIPEQLRGKQARLREANVHTSHMHAQRQAMLWLVLGLENKFTPPEADIGEDMTLVLP
mmetsp:Transcript_21448/g.53519  ORF Transcript_21448/g.53519 Transcript_21448/m.53519 type:complete len:93 (-) Transcript_21448:100-378(-)